MATTEATAKKTTTETKLLEEGCEGKVKWFNCRRGYGFIEKTGGEDIFVHRTAIPFSKSNKAHAARSLDDGEDVAFDIREGRKGAKEAWSVTGPDASAVKGSRYAITKRDLWEKLRQRRRSRKETKDDEEGKDDAKKDEETDEADAHKGDGEAMGKKQRRRPGARPKKTPAADGDSRDDKKAEAAGGDAGKEADGEAPAEGSKKKKPARKGPQRRRQRNADSAASAGSESAGRRRTTASDDSGKEDKEKDDAATVKGRVKEMINKVHGLTLGKSPETKESKA